MSSFDNVTYSNKESFGKKKGRITLSHTEISSRTPVKAHYSNNSIIAEATIKNGTLSHTYFLPKGASIKRQSVTYKAKSGFMRVYFNKLTDFDLEDTCASQEPEEESD
ncbi:hypothetical protein LOTGIDRAFT_229961 [Lottia gigantea]|uniref:Uncharacterized protein n=1 Tax=Lottia gigantea TaxID=225164 RepID=V4BBF7_LOTGI|nr:hypothetical protein LOTGIDRAFT_229961 [Lottia gigantea]ESP04871.1 hypothetical protein LOTGIDRAFT_229961 [Lottia gigantea]